MEHLLANPEQITFGALFIGMLVYQIKSNERREKKSEEREEKYQAVITDALAALKGYEDVKANVNKIVEKIGA
jgi:hypothetical protein